MAATSRAAASAPSRRLSASWSRSSSVISYNDDLQIDATLDPLIKGCSRLLKVLLFKDYREEPLNPESRAHLESFKTKLLTKKSERRSVVLSESESLSSPFSFLVCFVFCSQCVERVTQREGECFSL